MIKAGELDQKITFQHKTISYDAYNAPTPAWVDGSTVYAGMITTGGKEYYAAQKLNAETTAVFKIRYTQAVTVTMRIKYGNRIFEILPPINDVNGKHVEILISAKEVA